MKKSKRFLSLAIAVLMFFSCAPTVAFAETNVAKINGNGFATIQAAVDEAKDDDTIVLTENVELENEVIKIANEAKKIALDLNGHTITGTFTEIETAFISVTGCELTIKDSSEEKTGGIHAVNTNGNLQNLIRVETSAKMVIESGNFTQDASVTGAGMIDARSTTEITIKIKGGNFLLKNVDTADNGSPWLMNVSGRGYTGIEVTGGTFNSNIQRQHWTTEVNVPAAYYVENNGDGTWTVKEGSVISVKEGTLFGGYYEPDWDVGYPSLKAFFDAANADKPITIDPYDPITLLQDMDEDVIIDLKVNEESNPLEHTLFLDLNGHNYTGKITLANADIVLNAPKGLKVVSSVEGYIASYSNGAYRLVSDDIHNSENHQTTLVGKKDPTCTEEGYTGDTYCEKCSAYLKTGEIVEKADHKDDTKDHACDYGCGKVYGEHADANKDHLCDVYGDECANGKIGEHADADKDHACDYGCSEAIGDCSDKDDDGDHECDYGCGKTLTNHEYGRWVKVYEPTETEPGVKVKTCHECGKKVYADVAPLSE
ncbi:MAG: hypothetical protein E7482_03495, partial [Ruminococcaceae bacterium]|nr:hypothetical protein [Oscillospiraceae bacterium]